MGNVYLPMISLTGDVALSFQFLSLPLILIRRIYTIREDEGVGIGDQLIALVWLTA